MPGSSLPIAPGLMSMPNAVLLLISPPDRVNGFVGKPPTYTPPPLCAVLSLILPPDTVNASAVFDTPPPVASAVLPLISPPDIVNL